jgi:dethiobiotin synthetase/adenosylmethionine--8-amino-7-oxononanoate aminotransferase
MAPGELILVRATVRWDQEWKSVRKGSVCWRVEGRPLSWIYDVSARLDTHLASAYRTHVNTTLEKLAGGPGGATSAPPLGALVLEPLVLGAGGMVFVDPLFQRVLIDAARARGLPVVFDEVFAGLWRLGMRSAAPLLGADPDVAVYAKVLTGGLVPLAVTLASEDVFRAFEGASKAEALLHGHSYSAYALGCEVANAALDRLEVLARGEAWSAARVAWRVSGVGGKGSDDGVGADADADGNVDAEGAAAVWSMWSPQFVDALSKLEVVEQAMTLGTVLAFKVRGGDTGASLSLPIVIIFLGPRKAWLMGCSLPSRHHGTVTVRDANHIGYQSHTAQALLKALGNAVGGDGRDGPSGPGGAPFSIHFRTLGDVAYFMTSLNTPPSTIRVVEERIGTLLSLSR